RIQDCKMGETDMLSAQFTSAYTYLNKHSNIKLSDEIKLKLYGTYKAATIGTCNTPKPSLLDFRGRAKWDSWNELGEISKEEAKQRYIDILEQANVGWSKDRLDNEETKAIPQDRWTYVSTLSYEEEAVTKLVLYTAIEFLNLDNAVEDSNDKHMGPWTTFIRDSKKIKNTPLTPYVDKELLYNNPLSVDGTKITVETGFQYEVPELTDEKLVEMIEDFKVIGWWPKEQED
ncbi:33948_t:CDS:2, partial [Racocetra persica]